MKHISFFAFTVALFAAVTTSCSSHKEVVVSQIVAQPLINSKVERIVDSIYNSMTMEERTAQLCGIRSRHLVEDGKFSIEKCRELIPNGIGHISQVACVQDWTPEELRDFSKQLQHYLMTETPSKIPAIIHEEAITGYSTKGATTYPQQIGVACSWNPRLLLQKCRYTAESMRATGTTFALSPMVDIVRSQHFNRGEESYGEDSYLSAAMGCAFVRGLQGKNLRTGVAATTKHFLGYGGGSLLSQKEILEEIITPHEAAIKIAGVKSIMPGYHSYNGESAITNNYFLSELLRDYMEFDGIVISDYQSITIGRNNVSDKTAYYHERATKAINAGADLELSTGRSFYTLPYLIESGKVSEERFKEAVKLNLAMKVRLGLLDKDAKLYEEGVIDLDKPEYRKVAYDLAAQSIVLLKNNGILPLKTQTPNVALVGPNANTFWSMFGDYTYQALYAFFEYGGDKITGLNPKVYTLKEGLDSRLSKDFKVAYQRGCDWDETKEAKTNHGGGDPRIDKIANLVEMLGRTSDPTSWSKAIELAENSDVIIAAVGENPTLCGEGRIRKGIRLPGNQEKFVEELIATGLPVVLVMFGGRAQVLSKYISDGCAAIVQAWYPGEEGGNALADILAGNVNPSAKLATSYPATESKEPLSYTYGEDKQGLVLYPFGYGLSYTTYDYNFVTGKKCSAHITKDMVEYTFKLTNSGEVDGTEIVQLYISSKDKNIDIKPMQLKGFRRIDLKAGESHEITFRFSPKLLSFYENGNWTVAPGEYQIKIGASSSDIRLESTLTLKGEKFVAPKRDIFFSGVLIE
ncbi:MAG: glycoside hydrolase family 3 N-terminal domain-containing protein [Rikenellaceae bacterium]